MATPRVMIPAPRSPLHRGTRIDRAAGTLSRRSVALRWALADPRGAAVAITISSAEHLEDVIRILGPGESIDDHVQRDKARQSA